MKIQDIPKELLDRIRLSFEGQKDIRLLRTAQQEAHRRGDFSKALYIAQQIDELWTICLDRYLRNEEEKMKVFDSKMIDIPQNDLDEMMVKLMVLFMCCDIVESAYIDFNDILHRTKPDTTVTAFNDLRQALGLAQEKLKYLQEKGDYMKDLVWAEKCDNMYDMMQSKAKSIIRKRRDSTDWGKNMEKYG